MSLRTSTTTTVVNEREKIPAANKGKPPKNDCEYAKYCRECSPEMVNLLQRFYTTAGEDPSTCTGDAVKHRNVARGKYKICGCHGLAVVHCEGQLIEEGQDDGKSTVKDQEDDADDKALDQAKIDSIFDEQEPVPMINNAPSCDLNKASRGEFLVEALSEKTVNRGPEVTKPWSSELSTADCEHYDNLSSTWRRAWLSSTTLNQMKGKQVKNHADGNFQVVFYVHGYSYDHEKVFISVPSVEAQCEVPREILQRGCGHEVGSFWGWGSEPVLNSALRLASFVDGLSETGSSMFKETPAATMASRIEELAAESPVKDADYRAASSLWKGFEKDFDEAAKGGQERDCYDSPGKLTRGGAGVVLLRGSLLEQLNGSFKIGGQHVPDRFRQGETEARERFPQTSRTTSGDHLQGESNAEQSGAQKGSQDSLASFTELLGKAASTGIGKAAAQRDRLLKKYSSEPGGDPDDDEDPSENSDEDGDDDNGHGRTLSRDEAVAGVRLLHRLLRSSEFQKAEIRRIKIESIFAEANQDKFIQKTIPIMAAAVHRIHDLNVELEREKLAVMRKMKEEERAYADKIEERKQDKALFPKANEVVQLARLIGDAGNNSKGGCGLQINPDNYGSAMYRELKVIANDPSANEVLKIHLTDSLIASLVGFRFGGAPKPGETELSYAGGASIYDALRRLTKVNDYTQRSFNADPPKAGKLPVISDRARNEQQFKSIYEVRDAWRTFGTLISAVFGQNYAAVFDACGAQMQKLYELDSDTFSLKVLKYLSDIGLHYWCEWLWRASTNTFLQLSDEELALSASMGFIEPTALPGMLFGENCTFLYNNVITPSISDNKLAMISFMQNVPDARKGKIFSALPYDGYNKGGAVGSASGPPSWRTSVGGRGQYDIAKDHSYGSSGDYLDHDDDSREAWAGDGMSYMGYEAEVGGADIDDDDDVYDLQNFLCGDCIVGGAETPEHKLRRGPVMTSQGKGHPKGGTKGGPQSRADVRNRAARAVKVPSSIIKEAFGSLPYVTGLDGQRLGRVCFLSLCNKPAGATCSSACPSESGHPNHRIGQQCNNIHLTRNMKYEKGFGGFTWAHFMISLLYRGFRSPIMTKPPPEDPSELQGLCDEAGRMHRDGAAVPNTFLASEQLVGAPTVDILSYFPVGAAIDTVDVQNVCVGSSKTSILANGVRFNLNCKGVTYTGVKSGKVSIAGWPAIAIKDYGSVLNERGNSCIFLAIGIAGMPFELDPASYMTSVISELSKPVIESSKQADYTLLRQQVESGNKILLTGLVHFGLPRHVAALVLQRTDNTEHRCVLFTCGQPKYVIVCYIEDNHIMPGVWADCPDGLMSYAQFEQFWVPYTLSYPDHVKITHIGTVLDTQFQFGNRPSGILLGGESNTGTWDRVMLGVGRYPGCHLSQCERGCFNESHHTESMGRASALNTEERDRETASIGTWKRESGNKGDIIRGTAPERFTSTDRFHIDMYNCEPVHITEARDRETAADEEAEEWAQKFADERRTDLGEKLYAENEATDWVKIYGKQEHLEARRRVAYLDLATTATATEAHIACMPGVGLHAGKITGMLLENRESSATLEATDKSALLLLRDKSDVSGPMTLADLETSATRQTDQNEQSAENEGCREHTDEEVELDIGSKRLVTEEYRRLLKKRRIAAEDYNDELKCEKIKALRDLEYHALDDSQGHSSDGRRMFREALESLWKRLTVESTTAQIGAWLEEVHDLSTRHGRAPACYNYQADDRVSALITYQYLLWVAHRQGNGPSGWAPGMCIGKHCTLAKLEDEYSLLGSLKGSLDEAPSSVASYEENVFQPSPELPLTCSGRALRGPDHDSKEDGESKHPTGHVDLGELVGSRATVPLISNTQKEVNGGLVNPTLHPPSRILIRAATNIDVEAKAYSESKSDSEEFELEEDEEEDRLCWGVVSVGDNEEVRTLSDEEKELATSQAGNKRKRDLQEASEAAFMIRVGSPQVQELQPLVNQLKIEIANLKSAMLGEAITGESQKEVLQKAYLKASNALCHASVRLCKNRWWPQLFLTAFRASHQGRVDAEVDPEAMKATFEGLIPSEVLRTIVNQATRGEEVYLLRRPVHSWAQESASVKESRREIWATIWKDTAYGSTFVFGPECLGHMRIAEVQGYALHRVPKRSTATGAPTGAFRLIANLSHCDKEGHSMNNMTDVDYYGKFKMVKHSDIAQSVLLVRSMFGKVDVEISKWDTSRAFRRKYLSVAAFGLIGCKISGHPFLDQSEVFGHNTAPSTYAYSSEAIGQAHRASGMWLTAEELVHAGYNFVEGEDIGDRYIPFFSDTYCDDGVLVAPNIARYKRGCTESYTDFMKANLGSEAVSMKDPEEQEWSTEKTVIGLKFVLGDTPDARGDVDFLEPTPERILRMKRLMDSDEFKPEGKHNLSAGLCSKAFSLWLWMCICCPRLKAFIGSFKRVFEGKVVLEQSEIVSPVRAGDDAEVAWQLFWDDMLTLRAILNLHQEKLGFFRVPLFRLLSEEEQLNGYPERFDTVSTDASFFGGGVFCHNGDNEGHFCRVPIPRYVINDLEDSMKHGHDFDDTTKYTIAIVEKTLHTLGLMAFGRRGRCYIMLQDNQNVVDWVTKGWGKPMRAQALLRRDVMHGMHLDIWSIIQYIHTSKNVLADLLSRSFDENGQDKQEVLKEFYKQAKRMHNTVTEVEISSELIIKLFPERIECRDMESLLHDVFDAEKYNLGGDNSVVRTSSQPDTETEVKLSWVSPLDNSNRSGAVWQDALVGGEKKYAEGNWRKADNKSVFKDVKTTADSRNKAELIKRSVSFENDIEEVEDEEFEVEKVLKKRMHPVLGVQYKVNWTGYSHIYNKWMSEGDLKHCSEVIAVFEALVKEKGVLKKDATDKEADSFYYQRKHIRETEPTSTETVSKGPDAHRIWKRGLEDRTETREREVEQKQQWTQDSYEPRHRDKGGGKGKGWTRPSYHESAQKEGYSRGSHSVVSSTNYSSLERSFLGPSLSDKINAAKSRNGRRVEVVIAKDDNRLLLAAAKTLAESMAKNTTRTYAGNFDLFLGFCDRQNLSPVLNGDDKRKDEATLIAWIMYEFEIQGNKYQTLKVKLSAVRAAMLSEGYPNPMEGKYTLDRHMKGIKNMRGSIESKEPLPAEAFRYLLIRVRGEALIVRCTALAIAFAFFFLLRISEFAARDKVYMEKFIALRKDISFFKNGKLCAWDDPGANAVELFIKGSKTDQRHLGCPRIQHSSGDDVLCPVKVMQEWFSLTHGSAIPAGAPLFSIPKGRAGSEWFVLTRDNVTLLMKGMAAEYNLGPEKIGTHSIRISGATALLLAGIPPATVQIIGRWVSNSFIGYQRYKAELMKGIADRMVRTHYATDVQKDISSLE